jgi:hypothetical protein
VPRREYFERVFHIIHISTYRTAALSLIRWEIAILDWKADLDRLVEETMAFAKSVHVEPGIPRTVVEPNRTPSVNWAETERNEIGRHIANFKAHQQRFKREREDYAASELKRMLVRRY